MNAYRPSGLHSLTAPRIRSFSVATVLPARRWQTSTDQRCFRKWTRPDIKHTSVYLPEAAYEALRQVAFDERCKIHDLLMEGVELALKKRGYPALADMKAKWSRKER